MADKRISELTELTTPAPNDELAIVDKDVPETKKIIFDRIRANLQQGLDADKPTAGVAGRLYFATDTKILYRDNGTAWEEILRGETAIRLAQLSEKSHVSLTDVTPDQHHPQLHAASHKEGGADALFIWATFVFTVPVALTVGTDKAPTLAPATDVTIDRVWIYVKTAPTGGPCTVDVNKNGVTIFTDQTKRPSIPAGSNSAESGVPDITTLTKNDLLTIDIDEANGAEDLTVHVRVKQYLK